KGEKITLYFNYQSAGFPTKVLSVDDSVLSNVNILIYNTSGQLVHSAYSDNGAISSVSFTTLEGEQYRLYCVANVGNLALNQSLISESALTDYRYSIDSYNALINGDNAVPMSFKSEVFSAENNTSLSISLERCVSLVTVSFDKSDVPSGVEFNIVSAKLKNIPSSVRLFGESRAESSQDVFSDGDYADNTDLILLNSGSAVSYFLFENMQGNLLNDNNLQSGKCFSPGSPYNDKCTYFEFEVEYRDATRYGTGTYRFFLGEDHVSNFDVQRNRHYDIVVRLSEAGMNENSWRVDVSDLGEFVSSITLEGARKRLMMDETLQLSATAVPVTARNKDIVWVSSNPTVASVSASGLVTPVSYGTVTITAMAADGSGVSESTQVKVSQNMTGIVFRPPNKSLSYNESFQTTVVAYYGTTDMDTLDCSLCTFSSNNTSVCTVSDDGVIHACLYDNNRADCRVTAQYRGLTGTMTVSAIARMTNTYAYPNSTQTVTVGATIHMQILQRFENGYTNTCEIYGTNMGPGVTGSGYWYSEDPSVATCTPEGDVVAVGKGVTAIRGVYYYTDTNTNNWRMGIIVN
ncbi:MAG: DUF4906 domain-containing protein, partial [Bacteroidales bacterium]|nr:DUF4906 domain-containing protein [Bacteroidales bacterium]